MKLREASHIHCIGAGGIGLSALAKLFLAQEKTVSGSDVKPSEITKTLAHRGAALTYGQEGGVPAGTDFVIFSDAVPYENPERLDARGKGIPEMSYAEALGAVSRDKKTIAVSGTNGKSTTTALIGLMLEAAGLDPTVIVGSSVPTFALGNLRIGEGELMVVEADDYHAHMLHLRPQTIVLTNIEEEHLDYFRDLGDIVRAFQSFVDSLPKDGKLILNADDPVTFEDIEPTEHTVSYGIDAEAEYVGADIHVGSGEQSFTMHRSGDEETFGKFTLKIPGRFNVMNALAAATCALELGVPVETIRDVLGSFTGIWRRFEHVGVWNGAEIYSDYGHHPTAIRGTLSAAREFFPGRRIVLVYQPHQRHRTRALLPQFALAFDGADLLILSDIYDVAGREQIGDAVSSQTIADAMSRRTGAPKTIVAGDLAATEAKLREAIQPQDIVIIMGAGDIDSVARNLVAA